MFLQLKIYRIQTRCSALKHDGAFLGLKLLNVVSLLECQFNNANF